MVSGAKSLLANGDAKIPFLISVYILAIGAGKFPYLSDSTQANSSQRCLNLTSLRLFLIR